jgi:hypothetical protein
MFNVKGLAVLAGLFLLMGSPAWAQTRLNFPRQLTVEELSTTGFAMVNTSAEPVSVSFNFYAPDGTVAGQSIQTVPAKGQLARLASEIAPAVNRTVWVQVVSASPDVQGFQIVGDFAKVVDGAGPAAEGRQLALIDFSRDDIVHIVNTSAQAGTVQVTLNSAAGASLGTRSISLAPFQPALLRLGDVNDDNNIDLVTLSADVNISASITTKLAGGLDIGLSNAAVVPAAPSTLFFPFAPNGPQGASNWRTFLGISNLSSSAQTVSLTFTPDTGAPVTIQRNLAAGASVGDTVSSLFEISNATFTAGWIRVTGAAALAGVAAYQDSANGSLAIVPSQSAGSTSLFFGHIASLSPWYTGLALLNTGTTAASVEVYAIEPSGQLVGTAASFSLAAGRRTALLSQFVPEVLQRASDGGWVFVRTTNNVPLLGFELFGHGIAPILANVQGFSLPSGSTFTPPPPAGPTVDLSKVLVTDDTGAPKTQFAPNASVVYVASITNTGVDDNAQLTHSVKDPRNNTLFSVTTTVSLPVVAADYPFLSFLPGNSLNGDYTYTATLSYKGKTSSKSATFSVSGGTATPSVGQQSPIPMTSASVVQSAYRPGDTVRFTLPVSNFFGTETSVSANYVFVGPGSFNAGSFNESFPAPAGISFRTVERVIPANAPQGLYVFTSNMVAAGVVSTKGVAISVVPRSATETIEADLATVTDSSGLPAGGFTPGTTLNLNLRRVSTFAVPLPATARYTITGPDGAVVVDRSVATNVLNGAETGSIVSTLSASAAPGTYTFTGTITYQDNNNETKTTSRTRTFVVDANPPAPTPVVTNQRLFTTDIAGTARTSFSIGETVTLNAAAYSSSTTPVAGTLRFQVSIGSFVVYGQTFNATYQPGLNARSISLVAAQTLPAGTVLTFTLTTTGINNQSSSNSVNFVVTQPEAPPLNLGVMAAESKGMPAIQ